MQNAINYYYFIVNGTIWRKWISWSNDKPKKNYQVVIVYKLVFTAFNYNLTVYTTTPPFYTPIATRTHKTDYTYNN